MTEGHIADDIIMYPHASMLLSLCTEVWTQYIMLGLKQV